MGRFLLQGLVFVLVALVPATLLMRFSMRHPPSYADGVAISEVRRTVTERAAIEALALGNSHAQSVDFRHLGINGVTIGLPWNDFREVEFQVRILAPRLPDLRQALIAIPYFGFHWSNDHGDDELLLVGRRQFYAAVSPRRWMRGDLENYLIGQSYWIARPDNWYFVFGHLLGRDLMEAQRRGYHRDREEAKDTNALRAHAEIRVPRKLDLIPLMRERHPGIVEANYRYLATTVRYLQQRGVRVVLFTPPYYHAYSELYTHEPTLAEMRELVERFRHEFGVEYHDFSTDPLAFRTAYFRDSDHLNDAGIERFGAMLREAVFAEHLAAW